MTPLLCRLCMFLGFIWGPICFQTLVMLTYLRKIFCLLMVTDIWEKKLSSAWVKQHFSKQRYRTYSGPSKHELWIQVLYILDATNLNAYYNPKKILTFINAVKVCHLLQTLIDCIYIYMFNFPLILAERQTSNLWN